VPSAQQCAPSLLQGDRWRWPPVVLWRRWRTKWVLWLPTTLLDWLIGHGKQRIAVATDEDMPFMDTTTWILKHLLNTVNSFLCSSINYFKNWLLPNDLIIVRNHGDDEEDKRDIKRALERQEDAHIKVEIQSNSEFSSLTSSPTWSAGSSWLQIDVHDAYEMGFGHSTYARKEDEISFPMASVSSPTKIRFD
jgi:hypothetical protein